MKMGKLCYLCDRKASKAENISLHCFPKNLTVRQKWLSACGLSLNDDVSHTYVCSVHFAEVDINRYNTFGRGKSSIKSGAIPSIFMTNPLAIQEKINDLSSAPTNVTTIDNIVKYECKTEVKVSDENCNSTSIKHKLLTFEGDDINNIVPNDHNYSIPKKRRKFFEPRYISEITPADVASPTRAARVIRLIKTTDKKKSKQIQSLQNKTRKLQKRITSLQNLVSRLMNKKIMSEESGDTFMK